MKILKKISKVIVIVMAVLATIWCGLYVYANYFYNDKQIDVENFYIAELPLPPSQFEEDFKEIHSPINNGLNRTKNIPKHLPSPTDGSVQPMMRSVVMQTP